jgi:hypothetical protein
MEVSLLTSPGRRVLVLTLVLALVGALAIPSLAAGKRRGKRSVGVVSAYDGTGLTVAMRDGSVWNGTVSENTKVKLEHRGKPAAKGNPSRGDLDDIEIGDKVLKLKARGGVALFIRLRKATSDVEDANGGECKDVAETEAVGDVDGEVDPALNSVTGEDEGEEPSELKLDDPEESVHEDGDARSCADKASQDDEAGSEAPSTGSVDGSQDEDTGAEKELSVQS